MNLKIVEKVEIKSKKYSTTSANRSANLGLILKNSKKLKVISSSKIEKNQ